MLNALVLHIFDIYGGSRLVNRKGVTYVHMRCIKAPPWVIDPMCIPNCVRNEWI